MEVLADALILMLWLLFFLATSLGVYDEYRRNRAKRSQLTVLRTRLEDDDPVYIMEPSLQD